MLIGSNGRDREGQSFRSMAHAMLHGVRRAAVLTCAVQLACVLKGLVKNSNMLLCGHSSGQRPDKRAGTGKQLKGTNSP